MRRGLQAAEPAITTSRTDLMRRRQLGEGRSGVMRFPNSLRVKLSILYLLTIVVPLVIIVFAMPGYYENMITQTSRTLTAATLDSLSHNIDLYLDDLDNLKIGRAHV